jgi:hypothetical protein
MPTSKANKSTKPFDERTFCRDNFDLLEDTDFYELYPTVRAYKLAADYPGFYFGKTGDGPFGMELSRYASHEAYDTTCQRFERLVADLFPTLDDARLAHAFGSVSSYLFSPKLLSAGKTTAGGVQLRLREYGEFVLISLLAYCITGQQCEGTDRIQWESDVQTTGGFTVAGQTLTVKQFNNGRVDVRGLTDDQAATFLRVCTLVKGHYHSKYQKVHAT